MNPEIPGALGRTARLARHGVGRLGIPGFPGWPDDASCRGPRTRRNRQVLHHLASSMAAAVRNLGIRGIDHIDFVVHELERSRAFYAGKMDFRATAHSTAKSEAESGERAVVFDAARVRVQ